MNHDCTPTPSPSPCLKGASDYAGDLQGEGMVFFEDGGQLRCPPSSKTSSPLSAAWASSIPARLGGEGGQGGEVGTPKVSQERETSRGTVAPSRPRLAIVGVGRAGDGDDGAGPALCAALERLASPAEDRLVVDAGTAPENATGLLRRTHADGVGLEGVQAHGIVLTVPFKHP